MRISSCLPLLLAFVDLQCALAEPGFGLSTLRFGASQGKGGAAAHAPRPAWKQQRKDRARQFVGGLRQKVVQGFASKAKKPPKPAPYEPDAFGRPLQRTISELPPSKRQRMKDGTAAHRAQNLQGQVSFWPE